MLLFCFILSTNPKQQCLWQCDLCDTQLLAPWFLLKPCWNMCGHFLTDITPTHGSLNDYKCGAFVSIMAAGRYMWDWVQIRFSVCWRWWRNISPSVCVVFSQQSMTQMKIYRALIHTQYSFLRGRCMRFVKESIKERIKEKFRTLVSWGDWNKMICNNHLYSCTSVT